MEKEKKKRNYRYDLTVVKNLLTSIGFQAWKPLSFRTLYLCCQAEKENAESLVCIITPYWPSQIQSST